MVRKYILFGLFAMVLPSCMNAAAYLPEGLKPQILMLIKPGQQAVIPFTSYLKDQLGAEFEIVTRFIGDQRDLDLKSIKFIFVVIYESGARLGTEAQNVIDGLPAFLKEFSAKALIILRYGSKADILPLSDLFYTYFSSNIYQLGVSGDDVVELPKGGKFINWLQGLKKLSSSRSTTRLTSPSFTTGVTPQPVSQMRAIPLQQMIANFSAHLIRVNQDIQQLNQEFAEIVKQLP